MVHRRWSMVDGLRHVTERTVGRRCLSQYNATGGDHEAGQSSGERRDEFTPLIDVLLVLLVIFLAALPVGQKSLDVNLPAETRSFDSPALPDHIVVEYTSDKRLSINRQRVALSDLESRLRDVYDQRTDKTLYITAAGTLRYRDVIDVIDAAKGAGVVRTGIITDGMRRAAGAQK